MDILPQISFNNTIKKNISMKIWKFMGNANFEREKFEYLLEPHNFGSNKISLSSASSPLKWA
jgi:hypothetical protein